MLGLSTVTAIMKKQYSFIFRDFDYLCTVLVEGVFETKLLEVWGWKRNNYSMNVFWPLKLCNPRFTEMQLTIMVFLSTGTKRKVGRPSVVDYRPEIIEIVNDFITQHSSAHDRRWDDAQYSHGITLSAIRSHVLRDIPSLKEISVHTIHCLLLPPNKNWKASKCYKSLVDAKRPPKRNDLACKTHSDFHYTSAQVNIVGELVEMFSDETIAISADDKNKVNVGTLAVSRHFSINNIFATDDQSNYPDHEFPYANAKLVPVGYLLLKSRKQRSRSLSSPRTKPWVHTKNKYRSSSAPSNHCSRERNLRGKMFIDALGRERIRWPRSGSLNVCLPASMFHSSTNAVHVSNLKEILQPILRENKKAVTIICDGGPGWTP